MASAVLRSGFLQRAVLIPCPKTLEARCPAVLYKLPCSSQFAIHSPRPTPADHCAHVRRAPGRHLPHRGGHHPDQPQLPGRGAAAGAEQVGQEGPRGQPGGGGPALHAFTDAGALHSCRGNGVILWGVGGAWVGRGGGDGCAGAAAQPPQSGASRAQCARAQRVPGAQQRRADTCLQAAKALFQCVPANICTPRTLSALCFKAFHLPPCGTANPLLPSPSRSPLPSHRTSRALQPAHANLFRLKHLPPFVASKPTPPLPLHVRPSIPSHQQGPAAKRKKSGGCFCFGGSAVLDEDYPGPAAADDPRALAPQQLPL